MNVHIIRNSDVKDDLFLSVIAFLTRYPGPATLVIHEEVSVIQESELKLQQWQDEEIFQQALRDNDIRFRFSEYVISWDVLFKICADFRASNQIPESDTVILLNGFTNDRNWFSGRAPGPGRDFFLQTNHWDLYVEGDSRYPIAYEIVAICLGIKSYETYPDLAHNSHKKSRGCINDFCMDKREFKLKLRTADICSDCLKLLEDRKVDPLLVKQAFQILEDIRVQLLFRERYTRKRQPSTLKIVGRNQRLLLSDLGDLEIHLTPMEKTVYLFFLNHPEGVEFSYMPDHFAELRRIYGNLSNTAIVANLENRAMALSRNQDACLSQVISRIRRKFEDALGDVMAAPFLITGEAGQKRMIPIDRNLVIFQE